MGRRILTRAFWKALQTVADNDTIVVNPGVYSPDPLGSAEYRLPLRCLTPHVGIQILGQGSPKPILRAYWHDTSLAIVQYTNWSILPGSVPALMYTGDGWLIQDLCFENEFYDKKVPNPSTSNPPYNYYDIAGIFVRDLGSMSSSNASLLISNCQFIDNHNGIVLRDTLSNLENVNRIVTIQRSAFDKQGPVRYVSNPLDHDNGHAAIMSQNYASLLLQVQSTTFTFNHDALESGNAPPGSGYPVAATLAMTSCTMTDNENGVEFGDGIATISNCTFIRSGGVDPQKGGTGAANCLDYGSTGNGGINLRGAAGSPTPHLTVRGCTFDHCQFGIKVGGIGGMSSVDLGKALAGRAGNNTFVMSTTSPWTMNSWWDVPYCSLMNLSPVPIYAVGNTWTYDPNPANAPFNQGVCPDGTFNCSSTTTLSGPLNSSVWGFAYPRPMANPNPAICGNPMFNEYSLSTNPNSPFNFSIVLGGGSIYVK